MGVVLVCGPVHAVSRHVAVGVVVDGECRPRLAFEEVGHGCYFLGRRLGLQQERLGWCRPAEGDGGEKALALQAEGHLDVHLGDGDGRQAEAGLGGVLHV